MENQHRKITGYRELSAEEIALMNEIKELGPRIEEVILKVKTHLAAQYESAWEGVDRTQVTLANPAQHPKPSKPDVLERLDAATPERFAAMAKTEFQTALMYLTRAVAQPTTF